MASDHSVTADDERRLLERAANSAEPAELSALTKEVLRTIAAREGIDFATALIYDRARRSTRHAGFIAQIERWQLQPAATSYTQAYTIAVIPASFYKEKPHSGADGRIVLAAATAAGFSAELVPLHSTGTLAENTGILREWLVRRQARPIIIVSLCKGGADVKAALHAAGDTGLFGSVRAWVNICGTLDGSPFAEWLLATKPRFFATWLFCKCQGHNFQFLREIAPSPAGVLAEPLKLPAHLRLINIVGFPLRRHLSNGFMRRCHQFIAASSGPNDGGVLLADVCRLPGQLYPVWGADHYLLPEPRAHRIIAAVLQYLVDELSRTADPVHQPSAAGAGS